MQNRRDQVQAHSFVVARLASGMLCAEPDAPFSPLRRFVVGTLSGLLVAALLMVGFGIVGAIWPGGAKSWRKPRTLVVEKETGARYVYLGGELRPVLNYTSARLILDGKPRVARVSRNSLKEVPRGEPVGIQSAPDSLPDLRRVDGANWQVCSTVNTDVSGAARPFVKLWVGGTQAGRPLADGEALVVVTPTGQRYLIWNNQRMLVPSAATIGTLGYAAVRQHPVGSAWINAVPAGPDLVAPAVPGRGQPGPAVGGRATVVGQILKSTDFVTDGAETQYFVVRSDGLSPLSPTGAALLFADPKTRDAYPGGSVQAIAVSAAEVAGAPRSGAASVNDRHPPKPPRAAEVRTGEVPCVWLGMSATRGPTVRLGLRAVPTPGGDAPGGPAGDPLLADEVVVAPGGGLLIRNQPAPGVDDGALYLLVDTAVRYPLEGDKAVSALGYDKVAPVPVPAPVLGLVSVGPPLSPEAALATSRVARPAGGDAGGSGRPGGYG